MEDKYVLYCLVSGIDPETFGMSQFRLLSVFTQGLQRLKHGVTIPSKVGEKMARNNSEVEVIFKAQNKDFNDAMKGMNQETKNFVKK